MANIAQFTTAIPAFALEDTLNQLVNSINLNFAQKPSGNFLNVAAEGVIYISTTSTGNGADTTEDTLATFSLPANTLLNTGEALRIRAFGTCAANGDNKTMKLYFGASVVATPTAATNNKNWELELIVVKSGANTQAVLGRGLVDTTPVTPYFNAGADTDTAAITIKCTGQAGTGNANDIVLKGFIVEQIA